VKEQHDLIHGMEPTKGCLFEWGDKPENGRIRACSRCTLEVVDLSGMNEPDMNAFLRSRGFRTGMRLYRRPDGKFVLGDCYKQRHANMPTAVGFSLMPFAGYALFWHPSAAILANPLTYAALGPFFVWLAIGVAVASRTRSATLCGVVFAIFILPALLAPFLFPM
jgi:hypothetical protein